MWKDLLVGALLLWVALEVNAWFPRFIDWLIRRAVQQLPKKQRSRYIEEWRAHVADTPGAAKKLWDAAGFRIAADRMFPAVRSRARRVAQRRRTLLTIRVLDRLMGAGAVMLFAPLLVAAGIATRLSNEGPVLFRHRTRSWDGREVAVLKFRTMAVASSQRPPNERVTWIGKFLRHTSVDELPSVIDVLRGEISVLDMCIRDEEFTEFIRTPSVGKYVKQLLRTMKAILWWPND